MRTRRPQSRNLHIPDDMHYDCVQCGYGCSSFWEIPVDPMSEERLASEDLKPHQQRAHEQPPFVDSEFDDDRTLCRVNDVCVFLTGEKKCALHAALGPKEKPQTCIDFPFRFVDTPGGTYVGLTFACTAVLQDHGASIEAKRGYLEENYRESVHHSPSKDKVALTGRIQIEWEAYLALEQGLDDILSLEKFPLSLRLLTQSVFVDLAVRSFEEARLPDQRAALRGDEAATASAATDAEIAATLVKQCRSTNYGRLLLLAQRKQSSPAVQRAFIGLVTTFRQALWRKKLNRPRAIAYIIRRYAADALRLGRIHLEPLEKRFPYSDFRRVRPETGPGSPFDRLLTRYFRHTLFRKDLLVYETVRAAQRFQLMHYALIYWYLVAMMVEHDAAEATDDLVREALREVEKNYVHHTNYTRFLERQPVLATLIDSVLGLKRYAASMVVPPA